MGEAKRRKRLDPNYGKIYHLKNQQSSKLFLMGDIGLKCYEKYGRGILFNVPGFEPKYIVSSCSWLKPEEIDLINTYNPNEEVIIAELIDAKKSANRQVRILFIPQANQLRVVTNRPNLDEVVNNIAVFDWITSYEPS